MSALFSVFAILLPFALGSHLHYNKEASDFLKSCLVLPTTQPTTTTQPTDPIQPTTTQPTDTVQPTDSADNKSPEKLFGDPSEENKEAFDQFITKYDLYRRNPEGKTNPLNVYNTPTVRFMATVKLSPIGDGPPHLKKMWGVTQIHYSLRDSDDDNTLKPVPRFVYDNPSTTFDPLVHQPHVHSLIGQFLQIWTSECLHDKLNAKAKEFPNTKETPKTWQVMVGNSFFAGLDNGKQEMGDYLLVTIAIV